MKAAVVAEYYPRRRDPVLGVWAHRQAMATRDAGAGVQVLVLERPVPPLGALRRPRALAREIAGIARQPRRDTLDGIPVEYVRFLAPPRGRSYAGWHRYARRPLAKALARAEPDLVHAHYALPAGAAALPFTRERGIPLVVSVHGGDVHGPLLKTTAARARVAEVLSSAAAVLCNSRDTLRRAAALTGSDANMRVVHLGADAPADPPPKRGGGAVATVGHVIPRKRHEDVLEALRALADVRWVVIGDGPGLPRLKAEVERHPPGGGAEFLGQLPPGDALRELARCHAMALPSEDEAFGVAYIEAMACGVPAIGCRGEGGPEEIAATGPGMLLVPPRDPGALREAILEALKGPEMGAAARRTAEAHFGWAACGRATLAAYEAVL